jgi:hypothetical protein
MKREPDTRCSAAERYAIASILLRVAECIQSDALNYFPHHAMLVLILQTSLITSHNGFP